MTKFIKVYDENGQYAIDPEDCPIYVEAGSTVVYDLNGDITICPKAKYNLYLRENDIIMCDLKTGHIDTHCKGTPLFINDPKYGIIEKPSHNSMDECFLSWNEDDETEPKGFGIASDLLTLDRHILIDFIKKIIGNAKEIDTKFPDALYNPKKRLDLAYQTCFGKFYGNINIPKLNDLSNEELVYLILECEN